MRSLAAQSDKASTAKISQHIQQNPRDDTGWYSCWETMKHHDSFTICFFLLILQLSAAAFYIQEKTKTATILIRGGAQQFIDEAARSLNDSLMPLVIVVM